MVGRPEQAGDIFGRESELRALSDLLDAIPAGMVALVIEGEAGIGKSTIFRDGVAQARERRFRTLVCQPASAEARMSFAALSDLLEPVIDELLPRLGDPQRRALDVALLRTDSTESTHDERELSVAFLNALRVLCERSPVLLAVDDAHWLDRPTARVVDFALRRLAGAPVGLVVAVRRDGRQRLMLDLERDVDADRRRVLCVGPLSLAALHHLLRARHGAALPRRVLLKLHELSGGNPFFALELARVLAERDEPLAPGEPLPVPATLAELVAGRLARLPARTRAALLVASALARPTAALVAAFDPGWDAAALLAKAERRGVIAIDRGRIRFSHPLLASTLYGRASGPDRRAVHRRLAEIVSDPEQRARHLALAADGPNERVAIALEQAAESADARGAPDAAAELCELACDATPRDQSDAARRRNVAAADHHFAAGDWERARVLAEEVIAGAASGPELARALHLLAKVRYHGDSFPEAGRLLYGALEHAGDEPAIRAAIELDLAYVNNTFEGFPAAAEHARAALEHAEALDDPGLLAEALGVAAMTQLLSGGGLNRERLERALLLEDRTRRVPINLRPSLIAGLIMSWIGESERACATLDNLRAWLVERGEESELAGMAANTLVSAHCWRGDLQAGARHAKELFDVAGQFDTEASRALALCGLAMANAYLGNVDDASRQAHESVELLRRVGWHVVTVFPLSALGLLHLSLDEPAETDRFLRPVVSLLEEAGLGEPSSAPFLPDEIEALVGIGELALAESLLDTLQTRAQALHRAVSLAPAWRCRGLLFATRSDYEGAFAAFERALEQHERAPRPIELARTLLALGQLQRRANQRRAAHETLERALQMFEQLEAQQWARRTRGELARLGLRRKAGGELTPTELQVAEHAASGMTNRQIAAALFVSPKTVEANLARVYRKLGISSRAQLGRQIAERERLTAAEK